MVRDPPEVAPLEARRRLFLRAVERRLEGHDAVQGEELGIDQQATAPPFFIDHPNHHVGHPPVRQHPAPASRALAYHHQTGQAGRQMFEGPVAVFSERAGEVGGFEPPSLSASSRSASSARARGVSSTGALAASPEATGKAASRAARRCASRASSIKMSGSLGTSIRPS